MSRARYYISFNAGVNYSEFWPSNEPKLNLVREGDEIFKRWKVDKFRITRTKNEAVFDTIRGMFFDPAYYATDLLYKINILGVDKFFFIDPVTSVSLDSQNMVYEATPDTNDEYRPVLQQYNKKWQDRTANYLLGVRNSMLYSIINTGSFTNADFDVWGDIANTVTWQNLSFASTQYAYDTLISSVGTGGVVTVYISGFAGDDFYITLVDGGYVPMSAPITISGNGKYEITVTGFGAFIVEMSANPGSGTFHYEVYYGTGTDTGGSVYDILHNVINTYMGLTYDIISTILWNDALGTDPPAVIDAYITANPTNDYVLEDVAIWNGLWLTRVDSFTTAKEDILETSLKDVMMILRKIRMYWFFDEDGKFRIEHEKYFRSYDPQTDLTSITYLPDKPEVDQRVYRYEKGDSYTQINYSEQNQDNEDWVASPVNFSSTLTTNNIKDISFSTLTTDFEYVISNPGEASSSGYLLLRTVGALYTVAIDDSVLTPVNHYLNTKLSWAWLFANYYDYFAEAETGTINNGVAHTYTHVKEYLKQGNIKFRMAADFDWKRPFTLVEGTGWVEAAEYSPETGMYKIDVGYNPYSITIYVVDSEDMGIKIVDDDGTTLITI